MSELAGRRALGVLGRALGIGQRPPRALQERASGVGELHLAGGADEEIDPEVAFELRIAALSGGCAMCSRSAARLKFSSSATAMKYRRWRSSTMPGRSLRLSIRARSRDRPNSCWPRATRS